MSKKKYETLRELYLAGGELVYSLSRVWRLHCKREGYKDHQDAVYSYLVHKFSWPLAQVRGMSFEDIRFVLAEEMHGWTLPKDAIFK
jgi:hypothetical protein